MIWLIYFILAIASGAWAWISGQWVPLVVVCAAVILTIILESVQRQNRTPRAYRNGEVLLPSSYDTNGDEVAGEVAGREIGEEIIREMIEKGEW